MRTTPSRATRCRGGATRLLHVDELRVDPGGLAGVFLVRLQDQADLGVRFRDLPAALDAMARSGCATGPDGRVRVEIGDRGGSWGEVRVLVDGTLIASRAAHEDVLLEALAACRAAVSRGGVP